MPNWLQKLTKRRDDGATVVAAPIALPSTKPRFEPAPEFSTTLAVDSPRGPGRASAEALYRKWTDKWQEF